MFELTKMIDVLGNVIIIYVWLMWVSNIILLATKMTNMTSDMDVNCQVFVIKLTNFCAKCRVFYD
jgi:uncharacterized BrkB/YihY/UPF0761 family membrane protein